MGRNRLSEFGDPPLMTGGVGVAAFSRRNKGVYGPFEPFLQAFQA
jgi:hypothetical protein